MDDERVVIGLMSGTSADGIDAVAVHLQGTDPPRLRVGPLCHLAFEDAFRARVLAAPDARAPELALLHVELGRRFGDAARAAMEAEGLAPADVAAIACAGVTVVHLPPDPAARGPDAEGATLALGDGDVIAERTGCRVVSDLRARDRAAGGHGAPLVPFADRLLLHDPGRTRAALNLGGIANLTVVPPAGDVIAFDTGPGNMLLDGAVARQTRPTDFGGYLDIVFDFLFYGSIPLAFAILDPEANALAAAILLMSFYANGASFLAYAVMAEKRGIQTAQRGTKSLYFTTGLAEASETLAVFVLFCLLPQHFALIAYIFAAMTAWTFAWRVRMSFQAFG